MKYLKNSELTVMQKDFIGSKFALKSGAKLSVVDVYGMAGTCALFVLECEICSKDEELWPYGSIISTKGNLIKGQTPCGCSTSPSWSKSQYEILIGRKCSELGYNFLCFVGEWKGAKTRLQLHNLKNDHKWDSSNIDNLLNNGHGCPLEAGNKLKTQKERELQINNFLCQEMGSFISWEDGCYSNAYSKFNWLCKDGHPCSTSVDNFLIGRRCPTCTQFGFNPSKPAWFYIVQWYGFGESYLKYGITNQEDYMVRINQQSIQSKLDYYVLEAYHHEDGQLVLDAENALKYDILKEVSGSCPKDWLPDGYSETVEDTPENLQIILDVVGKYLNIR